MTEVTFVPGDEEWHRLRKRCQTDLWWLTGVVLGMGDVMTMTEGMHRLYVRFLERKTGIPEIDSAPYRMVLMPRGSGKSVLGTQAWALQKILQNPDVSILIANEKLLNATTYLSAIKNWMMSNELLRALFPEIIPTNDQETMWATDRICVKRSTARREPTIFCIGVEGAIAGQHPDIIINDDLIGKEAAEAVRAGNTEITAKVNRWIIQLWPLLNHGHLPFPEMLFNATRWYDGDPYEFVEEAFGYKDPRRTWSITLKLPNGTNQVLPVYRTGDLAVFKRAAIENGLAAWPERKNYDLESLSRLRLIDPIWFAANMLNDPTDEAAATFKEGWLKYFDWLDGNAISYVDGVGAKRVKQLADLDIIMLVDPGGFKIARKSSDRARGAIVVTGSDQEGNHVILEAWSEDVTFLQVAQKIVELHQRYLPRRIGIEAVAQQPAFIEVVRNTFERNKVPNVAPIQNLEPKSKDKDQRILGLEGYFQRGQMYIGKGPGFAEFRDQFRTWPRGRRRDVLDALAYGPTMWRVIYKSRPHAERHRQELAILHARMGRN